MDVDLVVVNRVRSLSPRQTSVQRNGISSIHLQYSTVVHIHVHVQCTVRPRDVYTLSLYFTCIYIYMYHSISNTYTHAWMIIIAS